MSQRAASELMTSIVDEQDEAAFQAALWAMTVVLVWQIWRFLSEPLAQRPHMVPVMYEMTRFTQGSVPFVAIVEEMLHVPVPGGARNDVITAIATLYYTYGTPGLTAITLQKAADVLGPKVKALQQRYLAQLFISMLQASNVIYTST